MPPTDLSSEISVLRSLGDDFSALQGRVLALPLAPGTDTRRALAAAITDTHAVTVRAMNSLASIDTPSYAALPGSVSTLTTLAALVNAAGIATADLTAVLAANPLEGTASSGPAGDATAVRAARHAEALPVMAAHRANAVVQLATAATCCAYTATHLKQTLNTAATGRRKPPAAEVTASQAALLTYLSDARKPVAETTRGGPLEPVGLREGHAFDPADLQTLTGRGLIDITTTPGSPARSLAITAQGGRILARYNLAKVDEWVRDRSLPAPGKTTRPRR